MVLSDVSCLQPWLLYCPIKCDHVPKSSPGFDCSMLEPLTPDQEFPGSDPLLTEHIIRCAETLQPANLPAPAEERPVFPESFATEHDTQTPTVINIFIFCCICVFCSFFLHHSSGLNIQAPGRPPSGSRPLELPQVRRTDQMFHNIRPVRFKNGWNPIRYGYKITGFKRRISPA